MLLFQVPEEVDNRSMLPDLAIAACAAIRGAPEQTALGIIRCARASLLTIVRLRDSSMAERCNKALANAGFALRSLDTSKAGLFHSQTAALLSCVLDHMSCALKSTLRDHLYLYICSIWLASDLGAL
jgi:hypothetical protein